MWGGVNRETIALHSERGVHTTDTRMKEASTLKWSQVRFSFPEREFGKKEPGSSEIDFMYMKFSYNMFEVSLLTVSKSPAAAAGQDPPPIVSADPFFEPLLP